MIFSSIQYLLFLPVVAFLYWQLRGTARLILVVVASYIFYMSWLPLYGILLFLMTTLNWLLGLGMAAARTRQMTALLKGCLYAGLLGNLGCLCYYKYANFFMSNAFLAFNKFTHIAGSAAVPQANWVNLNVILPLGISFFVFEFVHYLVDVYKGTSPVKSWLQFAAFAAFFPSQIAGPIKRFQDFLIALQEPTPLNWARFGEAGTLIVQGLYKKVAIADPISGVIATAFAPHQVLSAPDALIAAVGFWIQVYCDFSGYTDMGRGSALLLGIRLPENFNLPYLATDIISFWRRWHMSLSSWLRDYCYIPLGGSRNGLLMNWRNSFLTMVACGLWHGADWHYVIFGCLQGIALIVNRQWKHLLQDHAALSAVCESGPGKVLSFVVTTVFVVATYTLFRAPDVPVAFNMVASWFSADKSSQLLLPLAKSGAVSILSVYLGFWLLTEWVKFQRQDKDISKPVYPAALRFASWTAAVLLVIAARPTTATPFVYFQF